MCVVVVERENKLLPILIHWFDGSVAIIAIINMVKMVYFFGAIYISFE